MSEAKSSAKKCMRPSHQPKKESIKSENFGERGEGMEGHGERMGEQLKSSMCFSSYEN